MEGIILLLLCWIYWLKLIDLVEFWVFLDLVPRVCGLLQCFFRIFLKNLWPILTFRGERIRGDGSLVLSKYGETDFGVYGFIYLLYPERSDGISLDMYSSNSGRDFC